MGNSGSVKPLSHVKIIDDFFDSLPISMLGCSKYIRFIKFHFNLNVPSPVFFERIYHEFFQAEGFRDVSKKIFCFAFTSRYKPYLKELLVALFFFTKCRHFEKHLKELLVALGLGDNIDIKRQVKYKDFMHQAIRIYIELNTSYVVEFLSVKSKTTVWEFEHYLKKIFNQDHLERFLLTRTSLIGGEIPETMNIKDFCNREWLISHSKLRSIIISMHQEQ